MSNFACYYSRSKFKVHFTASRQYCHLQIVSTDGSKAARRPRSGSLQEDVPSKAYQAGDKGEGGLQWSGSAAVEARQPMPTNYN